MHEGAHLQGCDRMSPVYLTLACAMQEGLRELPAAADAIPVPDAAPAVPQVYMRQFQPLDEHAFTVVAPSAISKVKQGSCVAS